MKKCPGCGYLWADDYSGTCLECGKPLGAISSTDLNFRYAGQIQASARENEFERAARSSQGKARPGDAYDRLSVPDPVLEAARRALVQREEVRFEDDAA